MTPQKFFIGILCIFATSFLEARLVISGTEIKDSDLMPRLSPEGHYRWGLDCYKAELWDLAAKNFRVLGHCFPKHPLASEAYYFCGVSLFQLGELDEANRIFSSYLKTQNNPKYFIETMQYKYAIAENFRRGKKRRMFEQRSLPKWAGAELLCVEIYDEIIASIPCDELACKALFCKADMLAQIRLYSEAVTSLQTLIRRFPKNPLAIESYLFIHKIFVVQSQIEIQNSDILELARINQRHFEEDYPQEERVAYGNSLLQQIEGQYAQSLTEIGRLYERKGDMEAARIYYLTAARDFATTEEGAWCQERLKEIPTEK